MKIARTIYALFVSQLVLDNSRVNVVLSAESREVWISEELSLTFQRVAPAKYRVEYPDYFVAETEITNRQFDAYLRANGLTKSDENVLKIANERAAGGSFSTGDTPYRVEDPTTIWRDNRYPPEVADHPVSLVTPEEATAYGDWLTENHSELGRFRLPTWNEWMIAAYGDRRAYPWGNAWRSKNVHAAYGIRYDDPLCPIRTEPVKSRPAGKSPEGIYGLIGNVAEYIHPGDRTNSDYFNLGTRWMGGGFESGQMLRDSDPKRLAPRQDYWGYVHSSKMRVSDCGFRLILDPTDDVKLLNRPRIFDQKNNAWRVSPRQDE